MAWNSLAAELTYPIVGTGQKNCYDNSRFIAAPKQGESFYGQDAQHRGHAASYTLAPDGLTVRDNITGLTWQRSPDTDGNGVLNRADKLTLAQAQALPAKLNAAKFGGFADWRLPNIKELYSLFDARGTDPSGPMNAETSSLTPFIDTKYFKFAYGNQSEGERLIDSQFASSTKYVGKGARRAGCLHVPWRAAHRNAGSRSSWAFPCQVANIITWMSTARARSEAIQNPAIQKCFRTGAARRAT